MAEADAALGTTASQDLAAIAGGHALTEAMDLGALALLWLIGTNHAGTPPILVDGSVTIPALHNGAHKRAAVSVLDGPPEQTALFIITYANGSCQLDFWEISADLKNNTFS